MCSGQKKSNEHIPLHKTIKPNIKQIELRLIKPSPPPLASEISRCFPCPLNNKNVYGLIKINGLLFKTHSYLQGPSAFTTCVVLLRGEALSKRSRDGGRNGGLNGFEVESGNINPSGEKSPNPTFKSTGPPVLLAVCSTK